MHLATGAGLEYSGSPCCVIMEVPVFFFSKYTWSNWSCGVLCDDSSKTPLVTLG